MSRPAKAAARRLQVVRRPRARRPAPGPGTRPARPRPRAPRRRQQARAHGAAVRVGRAQHAAVELEGRRAAAPSAIAQPRKSRRPRPVRPARPRALQQCAPQASPCAAVGQARRGPRRPTSQNGLRSRAARVRSSPGNRAKRASASRSSKTMCSDSASRSAPATGTPALLQRAQDLLEQGAAAAHQDQHVAGVRRRASRRLLVAHRVAALDQAPDLAGDPRGPAALALCSASTSSGASQASRSSASALLAPAATGRRSRRSPARMAQCGAPARRLGAARPAARRRSANTASTKPSTSGVERQEVEQRHGSRTAGPARLDLGAVARGLATQPLGRRRPGRNRSTASRRRPRTGVRSSRRRRGALRRRRTRRSGRAGCPTGRARCPAPRPPGCGRCRRRACRAPRPRPARLVSSSQVRAIRSAKSRAPGARAFSIA